VDKWTQTDRCSVIPEADHYEEEDVMMDNDMLAFLNCACKGIEEVLKN